MGSLVAERYDALLCDLDGVVYRGDEVIEGARAALDAVRRAGASLVFLTNNSSRTPEEVAKKLRRLGVQANGSEVVTSAVATASMLRREGVDGASAFVIGGRGVREALASVDVTVLDGAPDR